MLGSTVVILTCFCLFGFTQAHMILNAYKLPTKDHRDDERLLIKRLSTGLLRGRKFVTPAGVEGFVFLSIPTAEPPVGPLRFRAPVPRKKWNGVLDATNYTVSCFWNSVHTSYLAKDFNMSEDCIQVHVFTNRKCLTEGDCAVAMYIHGGVFEFGTPIQFRQDFIIDNFNNVTRNVVFVTVSFRQAFLGVANFNHKLPLSIDMNAGLHDIVHALGWIKKEIHTFGGNPDRVTVMGHSGGGGLTKTLAMSPKSKHMINQIIAMSQSSDYEIVRDKNERATRAAAAEAGCADFSPEDEKWEDFVIVEKVIKCLRSKTGKELAQAQPRIEAKGFQFRYVARDSGENALMPGSYAEMFNAMAAVPTLCGTVSKEFLDSRSAVIEFDNGSIAINHTELHNWVIRALGKQEYLNPSPKLIALTEKEYSSIHRVAHIYDDVEIYVPTFDLVFRQTLQGADSYVYEYTYPDVGKAYDRGSNMAVYDKLQSPHHAQELAYLLGQHAGTFTEKDIQIKYLYSQIFADFINHGTPASPTRKWSKFDPFRKNYFMIDFPDPDLKSPGETEGYHSRAVEFWDIIVPKVGGPRDEIVKESQVNYDPIPLRNDNNMMLLRIPIFNETAFEVTTTGVPQKMAEVTFQYRRHSEKHTGINWAIMFWIGCGIIVLLAISHVLTCIKLKSKKDEYQHI